MPGRTVTDALTGAISAGVGASAVRPDGTLKVRGEFAFSSDLWMDGMLWGATLRSPHAHASVTRLETAASLALPGVFAVLTHEDVPGTNAYGLEHRDQPVLAFDRVRYQGEAVALVAADHPETARRALALIDVEYDVRPPVTDPRAAVFTQADPLHPGGNVVRHVRVRHGDPDVEAEVVVSGDYQVGMQDQAFLGPESGLAVPAVDGGVDLFVATQWLHVDRGQIAEALGLDPELVRITLAGVGGAFGAREDLSMQVHACMLAMRTGRAVKMVYSREESFFGHVHRHPALMHYEHGATREGRLVYVRGEIILDGGAYASSTPAVVANAATLGAGPYVVPSVSIDCYGAYTNNPPCGAMRGFGAVQAAFGYESQMDRLAEAVGLDPAEIRIRNAMSEGDQVATGQVIDSAAPVAELVRRVRDMPLPGPAADDLRAMPGGVANTTHGEGVVRGVGYGVGLKNVCFSEGFDDFCAARIVLRADGSAVVHCAAAEVGQGVGSVLLQVARTELATEDVTLAPYTTATVGSAGSASASRMTWMATGAVRDACRAALAERAERGAVEVDVERIHRHPRTTPLDPENGQITGERAHVAFGVCAMRVVAEVDEDLGLARVVWIGAAQDVGRALNPQAVIGQIEGGTAQGIGLALMEEILT
ncbi:MAG: hypothetical protein QOG77_415, partial [Solirubrobacteraceae bacterium]|nr:hypothetical protein [Solirubrobacteraceae bacterium]